MAKNTQVSDAAVNVAANALAALANGGTLNIYDSTGTGQPANANTAVTTQVLLASITLPNPAFGSAVAGVLTANGLPLSDTSANNTGTATWFRVFESNGNTVVFDGSVGTSGANLNMNSTSIQANAQVSVTAFTYSLLESSSGL